MKFLFASLLLIGSFAQASDLEIKIGPVAVTALPIAMASCTDVNSSTSLAKAVVNFTLFKFAWKGQNTFMAQYAVLEIEGTALSSSKYGGSNGKRHTRPSKKPAIFWARPGRQAHTVGATT